MKTYISIALLLLATGCSSMLKNGGQGNAYNYFNDGEYKEAIAKVDRIVNKYDYSMEEKSELLFIKAESYRKLGDSTNAIGTYMYIVKTYPASSAAVKSALLLSKVKQGGQVKNRKRTKETSKPVIRI